MPDDPTVGTGKEEQGLDPRPDPWGSSTANTTQAVGTGAGATGAALLLASQQASSGTPIDDQSLALLPDPSALFGRVAHVLGFQSNGPALWQWGLVLVIVCVVLNVISLWLRYRYAQQVEAEYAAKLAARAANEEKERKAVSQAKARGFVSGDA
jgi:hypothetical protein